MYATRNGTQGSISIEVGVYSDSHAIKKALMMATAAVVGLSAGKRLLSSSFYYSDLNEKQSCSSDHSLPCHQSWFEKLEQLQNESDDENDDSVEVLLLLQKSMLEKQWNLSAEKTLTASPQHEKDCKKMHITCSGTSARRRRMDSRQRVLGRKSSATPISATKLLRSYLVQSYFKIVLKVMLRV
ncbi:hypothetical protein H5410_017330 [Solanum commersonii]|uniref:Uncharacterized protein n=1 Tax=Solanum commersonii TaxID=4109 RepID=A0A9J5ZZP5_SOLCO|nr:hypothetical protein H5410_017330 [Solanum commersonii]